MLNFWLVLLIFHGSHVAVSRTKLKPWFIVGFGLRGYLIFYSVLSTLLLKLMGLRRTYLGKHDKKYNPISIVLESYYVMAVFSRKKRFRIDPMPPL